MILTIPDSDQPWIDADFRAAPTVKAQTVAVDQFVVDLSRSVQSHSGINHCGEVLIRAESHLKFTLNRLTLGRF